MVHALKEAWQVLVPRGIMIDVRPLSVDVPLEIVMASASESAGLVDMSPGIEADVASDAAIHTVLHDGIYRKNKQEYFDFTFYWKTVIDFKADLDERWKDDVILPKEVLKQARILFRKHRDGARVRARIRMRLAKYTRSS